MKAKTYIIALLTFICPASALPVDDGLAKSTAATVLNTDTTLTPEARKALGALIIKIEGKGTPELTDVAAATVLEKELSEAVAVSQDPKRTENERKTATQDIPILQYMIARLKGATAVAEDLEFAKILDLHDFARWDQKFPATMRRACQAAAAVKAGVKADEEVPNAPAYAAVLMEAAVLADAMAKLPVESKDAWVEILGASDKELVDKAIANAKHDGPKLREAATLLAGYGNSLRGTTTGGFQTRKKKSTVASAPSPVAAPATVTLTVAPAPSPSAAPSAPVVAPATATSTTSTTSTTTTVVPKAIPVGSPPTKPGGPVPSGTKP